MPGKLLLRFDDICPTMNWTIWHAVENVMTDAGVKPLVAVIPENRDPEFRLAAPREDFWDRVRLWQSWGWTIGVHGYQHSYVTSCSGLLGIHRTSEFAGLPFKEQERKINLALGIFQKEGVRPRVWVAPGHSFDSTTLRALAGPGLNVISDGFSIFPYQDGDGTFWIPQQLWRFRKVPFGVWTVCLHHNCWGPSAVERFRHHVASYASQISSFDEILSRYRGRKRTCTDAVSALTLRGLLRLKMQVREGRIPSRRCTTSNTR